MALIALGFRNFSMSATAIGPVKAMVVSMNVGAGQRRARRAARRTRIATARCASRCARSPNASPSACSGRNLPPHPCPLPLVRSSHVRRRQSRSHPAPLRGDRRQTQRRRAAGPDFGQLSREFAELEPVVGVDPDVARQTKGARRPRRDARRSRARSGNARASPKAEIEAASKPSSNELTQAIRIALLPKDAADEGNVILEVRAGNRRRRGGAVRRRPVSHVRQIRRGRRAGRSTCSRRAREPPAATRKSSPRSSAAAPTRG